MIIDTATRPLVLLGLLGLLGVAGTTSACGFESLFGGFNPTRAPEAVIRGSVGDVSPALLARASRAPLVVEALIVDGTSMAQGAVNADGTFALTLPPGRDGANLRVVVHAGSLVLKTLVPEIAAGAKLDVGAVGVSSSAAAQIGERYAARERHGLASTPPATLAEVLVKASSDDEAVAAFRTLLGSVVEASDPTSGDPALDLAGSLASDTALAIAGSDLDSYDAALEAAVDASLVPLVCDPSRIRAMFVVDVTGQGKDGNGAPQFMRQPVKEGKVFLGITLDADSPVPDSAGVLRPRLVPNDPATEMHDDGTGGDEVAGDNFFTVTIDLPRGMDVLYKYTNGSPGEGFTGTEEWPGNVRLLRVDDVITSSASGQPDCLVIRRDSFGDESSNKNHVNLNATLNGGDLTYDDDLGGATIADVPEDGLLRTGGITLADAQAGALLTPAGISEACENGTCATCPAPLTVSADDHDPPRLVAAELLSNEQTRVTFSEDVDVATAGSLSSYLLVDSSQRTVPLTSVLVTGPTAVLTHAVLDPTAVYALIVKSVKDASLAGNEVLPGSRVHVGKDLTAPTIVGVKGGSIVDVNPAARPANAETGEVVVVTFSEILDRVSAENAASYAIDGLKVLAAFQRGRDVLLVTSQQARDASYAVHVGPVFDSAGNIMADAAATPFKGLSLSAVTFQAIVDYAWLTVDGSSRGLPDGKDLYLTGTALTETRALDGGDLRVGARTDVVGLHGFRFEKTGSDPDGKAIYSLTLRLPPGNYNYKLAYGDPSDALNAPVTLETVSKDLATRNDAGGVSVDPITMQGRDGKSYQGAKLSLDGTDIPGPTVLFKRENPDELLVVGSVDRTLPPEVIGTWRDVPFGRGTDYDDGLTELSMPQSGVADTSPPRLLAARARDSESVIVSFDEAIVAVGAAPTVSIESENGPLATIEVVVGTPNQNQLRIRTAAMDNDTPYNLVLTGLKDLLGNAMRRQVTAGFTSPAVFTPFEPTVDVTAPTIASAIAKSPTEIEVTFSERVVEASVALTSFSLAGTDAPTLTAARVLSGGQKELLTTSAQTREAPYTLTVKGARDLAGNTLTEASIAVAGFGESIPPNVTWARAMTSTRVAVQLSEAVTAETAQRVAAYAIPGLTVTAVQFGGGDVLRSAAFNTNFAPLSADVVLLTTSAMTAGTRYTLSVDGVADLSGNPTAHATADFDGVSAPKSVDVLLTYLVSDAAPVIGAGETGGGGIPARALSAATLRTQREGLFLVGTALSDDGAHPIADHVFTRALKGFPAEGAPLDGVEAELKDDGKNGDVVANDGIYSLLVRNVPLGSTLSYKAFASFTPAFGTAHPEVPGAAFADASRGPSVFADGQEFPGNDDAVLLVADVDGDGRVVIDNLFGDEITFKRKTGFPAFHIVTDHARRAE